MATSTRYIFSNEQLTTELNISKELFLAQMVREKKITPEQLTEMNEYALVVHTKSMLGKWWDKLWNNSDDKETYISVVKVLKYNPQEK